MALFGKKAEITITPERQVYVSGETVTSRIRIVGEKGVHVTRGDVELVSSTRFRVRTRDRTGDDRGSYDYTWQTDDVVVGGAVILQDVPLTEGQVVEQEVAFVIPFDAPPSGGGSITSVEWMVRVRLDVKGFDAKAATVIGVLSPPSYAMAAAHEPPVHKADDCTMTLALQQRSVPVGGVLQGTVTVTPRAEMKAKRLRLRLERAEWVPAREGNSDVDKAAQPVLAEDLGTMAAGVPVTFPFAIQLPPQMCPTFRTRQSTVLWRLVAEVDRRLRKDEEVEVALNVYSAYHLAPDSGY